MLLLEKLKNKEQFSSLDLAIINYVLENPKQVTKLTVGELAKVTYTSPSSVVRLCKKLGMKGYADFRIKLATEINTFLINEEKIEVDMPIRPEANIEEVAKTFFNLHYQSLINAYNNIDYQAIASAVELIHNADYIDIRGNGPSLIIGQDFAYKLRKIGLPVVSSTMIGFDTFTKIKRSKNAVTLIISNYGQGSFVRDWMNVAKYNGSKVIMLCSNKNSAIFANADIQINTESHEGDRATKLGAFESRTTMSYILDIIYSLIFMKDYNLNVKEQYEHGKFLNKFRRYTDNEDL